MLELILEFPDPMLDIIESLDVLPRRLVKFIQFHANQHGISLKLTKYGELYSGPVQCNGYFDDQAKTLAFWIDKDNLNWMPVAVHEYSHMTQWVNRRKFWDNLVPKLEDLDAYLRGQNISNKRLNRSIDAALWIEYDNEKSTLKLINKLSLESVINPVEYVQKANAYILFYHIIKKYAKFYPMGHEPYNVEAVWKNMQSDFDYNPTKPDPKYIEILDNYYKPHLG